MKIIVLTFAVLFNSFFQSTLPSETSNQIIQTSKDEKEFSDEVLLNTTRKLTRKIENKLQEEKNIDLAAIGISYQIKEIRIRVNGNKQYLNKVEKDVKEVANELAQETIFKDYSVAVNLQKPSSATKVKTNVNSLEKIFLNIGYKEVNKALQESKDYFKRDIALPTQLPPVTFTHNFGRFNHSFGKENDQLEITYINENVGQNHYQIRVKSVQYKLEFSDEKIDHTIKLNDGSAAIYSTKLPLDVLVFEKHEWQYTLLVDKRISNTVTKEVLVDIANSIR
ncbi:hypothetical protein [Paenisporosarcina sp.]|uniref:hypothetical protein n=1 Tax=Paenisporosarcina sp. TaxID=1932001 RepID=UPI003C74DD49